MNVKSLAAGLLAGMLTVPAFAADPILVRVGQPASPKAHINANLLEPWTVRVTAASKGTLNVKLFAGGTLGGNREAYDSVKNGVADAIYLSAGYYPGKFPKSEVVGLPGEVDKSLPASIAVWNLLQKGLIADEWSDFRVLGMFVFPAAGLHSNFPIEKIEDVKGKKIGTTSKLSSAVIELLGAIPVNTGFTEAYPSLSRGTIQAYLVQWTGMQPLRLWEVAKFHTDVQLGGATTVIMAMNKQSYAKLPADGKAAFDENSGEKLTRELGEFWDHVNASGRKMVEAQKDNKIFDPDPAESRRWTKALSSLTDQWVKETAGGDEILAAYRAERDKAAGK